MNRGGQFFLMAAILIVGALLGLTVVVNYVNTNTNTEEEQFYDLGKEIGFEAKQVLDYGTYNEENTGSLIESLIANYSSQIAEDRVVFIYGDGSEITAFYFDERGVGNISINFGGPLVTLPYTAPQTETSQIQASDGIVTVSVNGTAYPFTLRQGQNFYFVLIREENDDRFVTTG